MNPETALAFKVAIAVGASIIVIGWSGAAIHLATMPLRRRYKALLTLGVDNRKRWWLARKGYAPANGFVIDEWRTEFGSETHISYEEAKKKFKTYRRFGKKIYLYSDDYLINTPLDVLKSKHRKNIKNEKFREDLQRSGMIH